MNDFFLYEKEQKEKELFLGSGQIGTNQTFMTWLFWNDFHDCSFENHYMQTCTEMKNWKKSVVDNEKKHVHYETESHYDKANFLEISGDAVSLSNTLLSRLSRFIQWGLTRPSSKYISSGLMGNAFPTVTHTSWRILEKKSVKYLFSITNAKLLNE